MTSTFRPLAGGCALVLAASCASTPHRSVPAPGGPRPPALDVRAHTLVVPPLGVPRVLHRDADGTLYFAVGGVRVRVQGTTVTVADQPFVSAVLAATPTDGGWVFVSAAGTVARAADFLGTAHFERTLHAEVSRAFAWQDGLVAVLPHNTVARIEGSGASGAPPPTTVLNANPEPAITGFDTERAAAAHAALEHYPFARAVLPSSTLLSDGEIVVRNGPNMVFMAFDTAGDLQTQGRMPIPADITGPCDVFPWGTRALLRCPAPHESQDLFSLYATTPGAFDRLSHPVAQPLLIGHEGHTLTLRGPCPEPDGTLPPPTAMTPGETLACTLDRDRDWREWRYPSPAQIVDVHDAQALMVETHDQTATLRFYDIDMARAAEVTLNDPTVEIARAGFTEDGRILVVAHGGSPHGRRSMVAVGRPGETLVLRPVGFLVQDLAMADAQRGLAVGLTGADLAETQDGGFTWLRISDLAIDGDPAAQSLGTAPAAPRNVRIARIGEWVECSTVLCRAGGVVVHRWEADTNVLPAMQ